MDNRKPEDEKSFAEKFKEALEAKEAPEATEEATSNATTTYKKKPKKEKMGVITEGITEPIGPVLSKEFFKKKPQKPETNVKKTAGHMLDSAVKGAGNMAKRGRETVKVTVFPARGKFPEAEVLSLQELEEEKAKTQSSAEKPPEPKTVGRMLDSTLKKFRHGTKHAKDTFFKGVQEFSTQLVIDEDIALKPTQDLVKIARLLIQKGDIKNAFKYFDAIQERGEKINIPKIFSPKIAAKYFVHVITEKNEKWLKNHIGEKRFLKLAVPFIAKHNHQNSQKIEKIRSECRKIAEQNSKIFNEFLKVRLTDPKQLKIVFLNDARVNDHISKHQKELANELLAVVDTYVDFNEFDDTRIKEAIDSLKKKGHYHENYFTDIEPIVIQQQQLRKNKQESKIPEADTRQQQKMEELKSFAKKLLDSKQWNAAFQYFDSFIQKYGFESSGIKELFNEDKIDYLCHVIKEKGDNWLNAHIGEKNFLQLSVPLIADKLSSGNIPDENIKSLCAVCEKIGVDNPDLVNEFIKISDPEQLKIIFGKAFKEPSIANPEKLLVKEEPLPNAELKEGEAEAEPEIEEVEQKLEQRENEKDISPNVAIETPEAAPKVEEIKEEVHEAEQPSKKEEPLLLNPELQQAADVENNQEPERIPELENVHEKKEKESVVELSEEQKNIQTQQEKEKIDAIFEDIARLAQENRAKALQQAQQEQNLEEKQPLSAEFQQADEQKDYSSQAAVSPAEKEKKAEEKEQADPPNSDALQSLKESITAHKRDIKSQYPSGKITNPIHKNIHQAFKDIESILEEHKAEIPLEQLKHARKKIMDIDKDLSRQSGYKSNSAFSGWHAFGKAVVATLTGIGIPIAIGIVVSQYKYGSHHFWSEAALDAGQVKKSIKKLNKDIKSIEKELQSPKPKRY